MTHPTSGHPFSRAKEDAPFPETAPLLGLLSLAILLSFPAHGWLPRPSNSAEPLCPDPLCGLTHGWLVQLVTALKHPPLLAPLFADVEPVKEGERVVDRNELVLGPRDDKNLLADVRVERGVRRRVIDRDGVLGGDQREEGGREVGRRRGRDRRGAALCPSREKREIVYSQEVTAVRCCQRHGRGCEMSWIG